MVCCLVSVGCGFATDPCLNQGSEIFLLAFWLLGSTPVEELLPLGLDMSDLALTHSDASLFKRLCVFLYVGTVSRYIQGDSIFTAKVNSSKF